MRRSPLRLAATLALAVGVVTCSDSASSPRPAPGGRAQISIAPRLSDEASSILRELRALAFDVTSVRVVITRPPSTVLKDTAVTFEAGESEVSILLEVSLNAAQEELVARVDLLDGITTLFSGTQTIVARQGQTSEASQAVTLVYVGPGANARRVEVQPPTPTIILGRQQQLTVAAFDAGNAPVSGLPVNWSTSNASVATVSGTGLVQTAGTTGTATITARSANGLVGSTTVLVIGLPTTLEIALPELTGVVGTTVAQPMTVRVLSSDGKPVPGVTVAFRAVTPGGSVTTATAVTDADGRASTTLTLGGAVGKYVFSASVVEFPAVPTKTTEVTASPAPPGSIRIVSGNGQTAKGALPVPQPLVVEVRDALGNAVPNATVRWTRLTGTGALPSPSTTTDVDGRSSTSYVLGNVEGTETVQADLPDVAGAAVTFTITVVPSAAALTKTSGDAQTGVVGQILPTPLTVVVRTPSGALATNTQVTFAVADTGSGWLAYSDFLDRTVIAVTDAAGAATVRWQLGTPARAQSVTATALGVSTTFTATAIAGAASRLIIVQQPPASILANSVFAPQPALQIVDLFSNPVRQAGFSLHVSTQCVGSTCSIVPPTDTATRGVFGTIPVAADANGLFTFTDLRIVQPVGSYQLSFVDATERLGSVLSNAFSLTTGSAATIRIVSGDRQVANGTLPLPQSLVVEVRDALGSPVPNATVRWTRVAGNGSFPAPTTTTDANGRTSTSYNLANVTGTETLQADLPGVAGSAVTFTIAVNQGLAAISKVTGDNQVGTVGQALEVPLTVLVLAPSGAVAPNTPVLFAVADTGSGFLSYSDLLARNITAVTNASGEATVAWQLGTPLGAQHVSATALGATATFTATANAGPASRLIILQQPPASIVANTIFAPQPRVQLADQFSNPVRLGGFTLYVSAECVGSTCDLAPPADTASRGVFGTIPVTSDAAGVFAFTDLRIRDVVGSYHLSFIDATERLSVQSNSFSLITGAAAAIRIVSGDGQRANGTLPLSQPLVVEVRDAVGSPVANATVRWTRVSGSGAFPASTTTTDANGRTSTAYNLANVTGTETLQADLPGVPGAAVTFTITVTQGLASVTAVSGDNQRGIVGQRLEAPLTVVVHTPSGAVAASTPVSFAVADTGSGWLLGSSSDVLAQNVTAVTDGLGQATVTWQLGTTARAQHVTATALGASATFAATAIPGTANRLIIVQQPPTTISANTVFAPQPRLQVVDQYFNPVRESGFRLFVSSQCVGSTCDVSPPADTASLGVFGTIPVSADANGLFTFTDLRINEALGTYQLSFVDATESLGSIRSNVFNLVTGPAASIEQSIPETEYTATARGGGIVDFTPRVVVTDRLGNPVAGVTVIWGNAPGTSGSQGTVSNINTVTDANGYASAGTWSLPATPADYQIAATVSGTPLQVVFRATTLPVARSVAIISGDNQSGRSATSVLAQPLVIQVRDQVGNPMPNVFVTWATAGGDKLGSGSFVGTPDRFTNASGTAQATYVFPSDTAGRTYRIIATADGAGGPAQTLYAVLPPAGTAKRWKGGTKGAAERWDVASNWETPGGGATSPPSDENVFIPNVGTPAWPSPVISGAASSGSLTIETSANVTILSGATLTSSGDVMAFGDIRGPGTLAMVGGTRRIRGNIAGGIQLFSQVTMAGNLFVGGDVIIVDAKSRLTAANPFGGTGISLHVSGRLDNHGSLQIGDSVAPLPDPSPMADISLSVLNLFAGSDITISELGTGRTVQLAMKSCHKSPTARISESKSSVLGGCTTDLP